jgi:hypothetical protein
MDETLECIRCHTRMEPGYIADGIYGGYAQQNWSPGEPKKTFWCGLNIDRKHSVPVMTLRCPKCGYLEFHAPPGPVSS